MRFACGLTLLLALGSALAQGSPRDVVEDCVRRVPAREQGLSKLEQDCPGLRGALQESGIAALIAPGSQTRLRAQSLTELLTPMGAVQSGATRTPDPKALGPILSGLAQPAERQSWWSRIRAWLQRWLAGGASEKSPAWLSGWLAKLRSGQLLLILTFVLLALVVISAGVVIYRELRAAGVFSRGHRETPVSGDAHWAVAPGLTLAQVRATPAGQRATLMFRLLVQRLVAAGRLPDDRSLTHRELTRQVALDDERQREEWRRLSALAERQVFAPGSVATASVEPALIAGEALYESIVAKRPT